MGGLLETVLGNRVFLQEPTRALSTGKYSAQNRRVRVLDACTSSIKCRVGYGGCGETRINNWVSLGKHPLAPRERYGRLTAPDSAYKTVERSIKVLQKPRICRVRYDTSTHREHILGIYVYSRENHTSRNTILPFLLESCVGSIKYYAEA